MIRRAQTRRRRTPPLPMTFASSWSAQPLRTTRSKPLAVRSFERVPRVPLPVSSHPPAVTSHRREVRGPLSDEAFRPASCHFHATPARERHVHDGPGPGFRRSAARVLRLESNHQPAVTARPRAVREDHSRTRSFDLPAATSSRPPLRSSSAAADPARSAATQLCALRLASNHPRSRPTPPSNSPRTAVRRSVSGFRELPRSSRLWSGFAAADPARASATQTPRTPSRVESLTDRRLPPLEGPRANVQREGPACELPPSSHP